MSAKGKWTWAVGAGFVAAIIASIVLYFPTTRTVAQSTPCPENYDNLPTQAERDRCTNEKTARREAKEREEIATAIVRPTVGLPTPLPATPEPSGFVPPEAQRIFRLNPDNAAELPSLRGSNSLWHIGAVPNPKGEASFYYALARPGTAAQHAQLAVVLEGNAITPADYQKYSKVWVAPQDVGTITITGVSGTITGPTGPVGIIAFTTSSGRTGTLNMATGTWTFAP